ncbi:hypothetical protein CA13_56820 [Planctomycetes bacterium CA13]|uniref:Uncharacterized protein n=1 Tax=Novipirellula herctigrandis TaxID=2527986 RepID=A0A5C5ZAR4_9BACT|nr:hypothetical protein CA13_56820 [Planctomycetes bacterium CA13]
MKKVLLILGGVVALGILSCGGFLFFAASKNADIIGDFSKLIATGNPDQFLGECTPTLAKQLERPLVGKWMSAINTNLGTFKDTDLNGFDYNTSWNNGVQRTESSGVANYEKGTARMDVVYVDGKIDGFEFDSQQMPTDWFLRLDDTSFYQEQAKAFLQRMVDGEADALYAEMHPALKEVKSLEAFESDIAAMQQWGGAVKEIHIVGDAFDDVEKGQVLRVEAEIRGEKATLPASVKFEFTGLAAPILGYGINNPSANEAP